MTFKRIHSRRDFFQSGFRTLSSVGAAAALGQAGLVSARAQSAGDYKALVCIFLYGGNDAGNLLIPNDAATYANYQKIRQNIAIGQGSLLTIHDPGTNQNFGLHPSFANIAALYNTSKRLALLANVGTLVQPIGKSTAGAPQLNGVPLPYNLYSHSDQVNEWQNATPQGGAITTGWSGRLADKIAGLSGGRVPPAIAIGGNTLQLIGKTTQPSTVNTSNFSLVAPATDPGSVALQNLLDLSSGASLIQAAQRSLKDAMGVAQAVNSAVASSTSLGVNFPGSDIGTQLSQVAKLIQIRSALGASRQIFFCNQGGYDTHSNQINSQVTLYTNLANALAAFDQAMGVLNVQNNVMAFTQSDFGRTFQPNGNAGTDHGWGSHSLIMGGAVKGGQIFGTFPNLALGGPDDSTTRGTWVPTTSTDQYAAALAKWFGLSDADLDYVFPNLKNFGYQLPALA